MPRTLIASITACETSLSSSLPATTFMRCGWDFSEKTQFSKWTVAFRQMLPVLLATVFLLPSVAKAQSSTTTARTPGAPAGSYKLGDADTINLFTGNLNYQLPLLGVGGRGEAQAGIGVVIEGQWDLQIVDPQDSSGFYQHNYSFNSPNPLAAVGFIKLDISWIPTVTSCGQFGNYLRYRVNMTYVEPDGTEHTLRDRVIHGTTVDTCGMGTVDLGRIFESTAGDFITFVTDTDIYTSCYGVNGCTDRPDGYLYFRDGTKSRVVGGRILWSQDRNGNKVEYTYDPNYSYPDFLPRVTGITDSIGRQVQIDYDVNEPAPYGRCIKITYKGFGGQDKIIRISRDSDLSHLLRTTQPGDATTPINVVYDNPNDNVSVTIGGSMPDYVKAIWLPDGRSYQYQYNVLGQLARVVLPTGGAIEYDFADLAILPFENPANPVNTPITNRVSEKRVYDSNAALVCRTAISVPTSYTSGVIPISRSGVVRDIELFDASGNRLSKSRHYFYGAPDSVYSFLAPWWHGKEFRAETFDTDGTTLLRVSENDWRQRIPSWCSGSFLCQSNPSEQAPVNNPFVVETRSTLVDGNLVSKVSSVNPSNGSYAFDDYNNQTDVWVYDFGSGQAGSLVKHTQISYINNANASGGLYLLGLINTASVYAVNSSGQETLASSSQTVYDEYTQYPLLTYGTVTEWQDPGSVRGNPTTVRQWLDTNNSLIETHAQFDQLGNVRKNWDALGRMSETNYTDAFTDSVNRNTYAFPTQTTSPIPDGSNTRGSNAAFVSSAVYDYSSGLVKTSTDINGQTTTLEYNDGLDRLTKVINPTGGGWTSFEYGDQIGNLYVKTTTAFDDTRNLVAYSYFDGLGRGVRSFSPKGGGIWVVGDTQYDAAGRVRRISKPYQTNQAPSLNSGVNPANNWITTEYDALSRAIRVTTADGSQAQTSYYGNTATVTDAALKKRETVSDALGRLRQVIEDPGGLNFTTNYTYDILGNLRQVDQGTQHRYYMYDSLSRLIRSKNPEQDANPDLALSDAVTGNNQWATAFDYYANGNVSARTDARGIKIEYLYDDLNRLYHRSYTATRTLPAGTYTTTPAVDYYYDGRGLASLPANSLGKVTKVSSSVSEMHYTGFDAMGRVTSSEQVIDGQTYQMPSYTYNLAGSLLTQTYPSGRTVKNDYDDGGKLSIVSGQAPTAQTWKTYASNFDYSFTDSGATSKMQFGNGRWESVVYNKRLQPTQIGLGTTQNGSELMKLEYNYGGTDNNGNLHTQTITVPTVGSSNGFTATQTYGYDQLNRLTSAVETIGGQATWQQGFSYDQYGNRTVLQNATTPALVGDNPTISTASNRITPQSGEYYQYDAAGNLTEDRNGNTYSFDGENKQVAFTNVGAVQATAQYYYDGDGRRVKKAVGNETTIFVYDAFNQLVAEYSTNPQTTTNPTTYLTADNQGTPRVNTDSSGNVVARHDYLPFGEEISGLGSRANHAEYRTDSIRQKYTGYEHDLENGLDYAQARYYASQSGRFTSVDPLMASASTSSPQSFNRYSYALNNPYKYVDPSGMEASGLDDETDKAFAALDAWADSGFALWQQEQDAAREAARRQQQQQQGQQTSQQNSQQGQAPQQEEQQQDYGPSPNGLSVTSAFIDPIDLAGNVSRNSVTFQLQNDSQAMEIIGEEGDIKKFQVTLNLKLPKDIVDLTPTDIKQIATMELDNKGRLHPSKSETIGGSRVIVKDANTSNFIGDHQSIYGTVSFSPISYGKDYATSTATFTLLSRGYSEGNSNSVNVQILGRTKYSRIDSTIRVTILPPGKKNP